MKKSKWLGFICGILFCFVASGCNKNAKFNYTYEGIKDSLANSYIKLQLTSIVNQPIIEVIQCEQGIYYSMNGYSYYLYVSSDQKAYDLNIAQETRSLNQENEDINQKVEDLLKIYFAAYLNFDRRDFQEKAHAMVNGRVLQEFVSSSEVQEIKMTKTIVIDVITGICMKSSTIVTGTSNIENSWEVIDFKEGNQNVNQYLAYTIVPPVAESDQWPQNEFTALIPEFTKGSLKTASYDGVSCNIFFTSVNLTDVKNYVNELKNKGFLLIIDESDISGFYSFTARNQDNITVQITLYNGELNIYLEK